MSSPRVGWSLSGRPPTATVPSPEPLPAESVLAVGDQVTVTAAGSTFEATITAVRPGAGAVAAPSPEVDGQPGEQPGLR